MHEPVFGIEALRGCDATHRASNLVSHPTHRCMQSVRQVLGGPMARAECHRLPTPAFQPNSERALSALREVFL